MKTWRWFAAAALWLAIVVAATFDFHEGKFGGFGVSVLTGKYFPPRLSLAVATTLFYAILFGWLIPLSIGVLRVTLRFRHRLR